MKKLLSGYLLLWCVYAVLLSCSRKPVTPETALQAYLKNSDKSFKWEIQDKYDEEGVTLYRVLFTLQQWRGIDWNHEMAIIVPDELEYNDALLFITGGSLKNGKPNIHDFKETLAVPLSHVSVTNKDYTQSTRMFVTDSVKLLLRTR